MSEAPNATETPSPPAPVDGHSVLCPLCGYDLRGLIEPRCPECGYRFVWAELLDRKLNTHPYLFEHHPRNNIWSFVRTAIGGLNPVRFWRTLQPQMTPRPRRLLKYWIVCTILPALLGATLLAATAMADHFYPPFSPLTLLARRHGWPRQPPPQPPPRPPLVDTLDQLSVLATALIFSAGVVVAWTISTFLALLVFQQTMDRAQIRRIHVARCVGYSFDLGL